LAGSAIRKNPVLAQRSQSNAEVRGRNPKSAPMSFAVSSRDFSKSVSSLGVEIPQQTRLVAAACGRFSFHLVVNFLAGRRHAFDEVRHAENTHPYHVQAGNWITFERGNTPKCAGDSCAAPRGMAETVS